MKRFLVMTLSLVAALCHGQTLSTFSNPTAEFDQNAATYLINPAATVLTSVRHYFDVQVDAGAGTTQLRWCATNALATSCSWTPIDGPSATTSGAISNLYVDRQIAATVRNGEVHVFYGHNSGPTRVLRHGVLNGSTWTMSTIDGAGGSSGQTTHRVVSIGIAASQFVSGVTTWLFIAYQDEQSKVLRLGWTSNGTTFSFADLDGAGGANGRITASVGSSASFASSSTALKLLYSDETNGDVREANWTGSGDWTFSIVDGAGIDKTVRNVASSIGLVFHAGIFHAFYVDMVNGNLIHAWNTGAWSKLTHDSSSQFNINGFSACSDGTNVHVFYVDAIGRDIRQSFGSGSSTWTNATVDGHTTTGGRVVANLGPLVICAPTIVVSGSARTGAVYENSSDNNMRFGTN